MKKPSKPAILAGQSSAKTMIFYLNATVNPVLSQATKLYAVNQTSFDELLAAIKAETQVREVLDRVLGEGALQKLDTAFKAIHSESTTGV